METPPPVPQIQNPETLSQVPPPPADAKQSPTTPAKKSKKMLIIIIVIVVLALIAVATWMVLGKQPGTNNATNTQTSNATNESGEAVSEDSTTTEGETTTFTDLWGKFTVQYPKDWQIETKKEGTLAEGYYSADTTITSTNGAKIAIHSANSGGRGGDCQKDDGDVPFNETGNCASKEFTFSEKLPTSASTMVSIEGQNESAFQEQDVYLVHSHLEAGDAGSEPQYTSYLTLGKPEAEQLLGVVFSVDTMHIYKAKSEFEAEVVVSIDAIGDTPSFFERDDIKEAEDVMRSFRFID